MLWIANVIEWHGPPSDPTYPERTAAAAGAWRPAQNLSATAGLHLEQAWDELLFKDEQPPLAEDPVAPARRSAAALSKASTQGVPTSLEAGSVTVAVQVRLPLWQGTISLLRRLNVP